MNKTKDKTPLSLALDHCIIASTGVANFAPYCHFTQDGWLVGYDGIVAAGARTVEQLDIAPDTDLFRHAINKAGSPYSITSFPADNKVVVRGHKVRAMIPTFPLHAIPNVQPDYPLSLFNENVRDVIVTVSKIALTRADSIVGSSIYLRNNSAVATDGGTIVEGWHGAELPMQLLLPREFADALAKVKTVPTHCGWGDTTFTVWFGPERWLRTNLYEASFPDTDLWFARMRSEAMDFRPIPPDMLLGIEALKPFRVKDTLTLTDYGLNTLPDGSGASYSFEHFIPARLEYPLPGLRMAATHGQWIAFCQHGAFWYGPVMRGVSSVKA